MPIVRRLPGWAIDWRVLRSMRYATGGHPGLPPGPGARGRHQPRRRLSPRGGRVGRRVLRVCRRPLAAKVLHDEGGPARMVVDLDAHQGNGTAAVFQDWPWATILDLYERDNFPARKEPEDYPLPVRSGLTGVEYLRIVQEALPVALDAVRPDLLIYNAGSDPFTEDPLAGFRLTMSDLAERDLIVVTMARERGIPVAMVLSGGYSAESWRIHTDGIEGVLTRYDRG
ncbi:MAG: hypothetical protein WKF75_19575 [Singulisphaera sp.]